MDIEKISIVVPVYNSQKTLAKCIDSLLEQTYHNIEIILVDDGSRDDSVEICLAYKERDNRINVIRKKNGGVSSARNTGIGVATGKFIMFCDSDDWVENDWCETLVKLYVPGSLVMCGYYCHYEDFTQWIGQNINLQIIPKEDFLLTKTWGGFAPWNKLFCLDEIKVNEIQFPENISLGEDQLFVWRYLRNIPGDIIYCQKPLNHYVWPQGQSLTLKLPRNYYKQCDAIFIEISEDIRRGEACSLTAQSMFYQDLYFQYERSIRRIFEDVELNLHEKILTANKVMQSSGYQCIVRNNQIAKNRIMQFLCSRKTSIGLYIMFKLEKY